MIKETSSEQISGIEIGKSTKNDILALLGLPNKRELKSFEGHENLEYWIYYKGRGRSSLFIPTGVVPAGIPGYTAVFFGNIPISERKDIAAILVFNDRGILVDLKTGEN